MTTRIVVGIDDSPHSRRALTRALEEARRRGGVVRAVHAWTPPAVMGPTYVGIMPTDQECREAAREVLADVLADRPRDVPIEQVVTQGPPAAALVAASDDADLLVVGSRGRGGFAGLLLGSTSNQVASHAHCPVMVVPPAAS